jgi:hypothetical protein
MHFKKSFRTSGTTFTYTKLEKIKNINKIAFSSFFVFDD